MAYSVQFGEVVAGELIDELCPSIRALDFGAEAERSESGEFRQATAPILYSAGSVLVIGAVLGVASDIRWLLGAIALATLAAPIHSAFERRWLAQRKPTRASVFVEFIISRLRFDLEGTIPSTLHRIGKAPLAEADRLALFETVLSLHARTLKLKPMLTSAPSKSEKAQLEARLRALQGPAGDERVARLERESIERSLAVIEGRESISRRAEEQLHLIQQTYKEINLTLECLPPPGAEVLGNIEPDVSPLLSLQLGSKLLLDAVDEMLGQEIRA